jgi:glyceraldehyde 3-phosphate dehydrogenase
LVSSDILQSEIPAIIDLSLTRVIDKDLVKVLSWYDNEWAYSHTLILQLLNMLK